LLRGTLRLTPPGEFCPESDRADRWEAAVPERPVISIVDDDMSVREALGGLVNAFGFDAAEFSSAVEFLRSGRVPDTSCLIADMQMPGMNGLELQAELVAKGRPIPIIFVTAFPDARTRALALGAGAVGFLGKPLDPEDLLAHIRSALRPRTSATS
jgi:FixJ family two-component response regulator